MEPFSIFLATFSLCTGLLGLVAGTVEQLSKKYREWHEYELRLAGYRCQLLACKEEVDSWKRLWFDSMRREDDDTLFWGEQGARKIQDFIEVVECQAEQVRIHLQADEFLARRNSKTLERLAFALAGSDALGDRISRIKDVATSLTAFSLLCFQTRHNIPGKNQDVGGALIDLTRRNEWRERFSDWIDCLHGELCERPFSNLDTWSLMLQIPEDQDGIIVDEGPFSINIVFDYEMSCHKGSGSGYRKEFVYRWEASKKMALTHPAQMQRASVEIYQNRFSPSAISVKHMPHRYERAQAAYSLAAWAYPLARTKLTADLCSCLIHLVRAGQSTVSALAPGGLPYCLRHQLADGMRSRTLLLLGATLAELILKITLQIYTVETKEHEEYVVFRTGQSGLDQVSLLCRIKGESLGYMDAVKSCFQFDEVDPYSRSMDDDRYISRVLKP